jgi:hypothetical protein
LGACQTNKREAIKVNPAACSFGRQIAHICYLSGCCRLLCKLEALLHGGQLLLQPCARRLRLCQSRLRHIAALHHGLLLLCDLLIALSHRFLELQQLGL